MSTRETQETLANNMKRWQRVENASILSTAQAMGQTENPIVRLVLEVIQRDSQMHHRVQRTIIDSLETQAVSLSPDELGAVWGQIEKHLEIEKETIELGKASLAALEGKKGMVLQRYLLDYLLKDEEKHEFLLENLEAIKSGMYPYG